MIMSTCTVKSMPSRKVATSSCMVTSSMSTFKSRTLFGIALLSRVRRGSALARGRQNPRVRRPAPLDQLLRLPDVARGRGAEDERLQPLQAAGPLDRLLGGNGPRRQHRHGDGPAPARAQRLAIGVDTAAHA